MHTRPIILSKTCPYCGARSKAEAKIPAPANLPAAEINLDDLGALVEKQSLSQLLALVELLPYKTFACVKCGSEFRLESRSARDLVGAMLGSMQPAPPRKAPAAAPRSRTSAKPLPPPAQPSAGAAPGNDWEAESLDALLDNPVAKKPQA
ncbi:MAG: hypothetical protein WC474_12955 [Hydrogenophilaceae bacterium]